MKDCEFMSNEKAWFIYNGAPAGELTSSNYFYVPYFPGCITSGEFICSVKGIFDWDTYEYHPVTFYVDTTLGYYILDAL
jgi:hypothetical protein